MLQKEKLSMRVCGNGGKKIYFEPERLKRNHEKKIVEAEENIKLDMPRISIQMI